MAETGIRAAPWWANPRRLATAGFLATTLSAVALLSTSKPAGHKNLLVKDPAPAMPTVGTPAERPEQWGKLMRREPKDPAVVVTDGSAVPVAPVEEHPAHWGTMMRRESKVVVAAGASKSDVRPSTFLAIFAAAVALVAFAQQMRGSVVALLQDSGSLKGKAK
eukprot:TRINITY_DN41451_c0_g1_i1.p2 TRINITY_DN41451_c0_g1~~TRINITY_DN41451_c0_g1_i1.p2  ORF type:complete len:163 (-),score=33.26 TRINITY_DN41451_c0_g1_i1:62-550(-)